jgi:hypothetical protein
MKPFNQKLFDAELTRLKEMFPQCYIEAFSPEEFRIADATVTDTECERVAEYMYSTLESTEMWAIVYRGIEYAKHKRGLYD